MNQKETKRLETYRATSYVLEDDGTKTGPVCQRCYLEDGLAILLEDSNGGARCPACQTRYPGVTASVRGFRQRAL